MKRVHYASGSFVTGDRIADALVHYAAVLARAHDADEIEVTSVGSGGEPELVRLLVGPASQMMIEALPGDEDFTDDALVDDLTSRSSVAEARHASAPPARADEGDDGAPPPVALGDESFLDPF